MTLDRECTNLQKTQEQPQNFSGKEGDVKDTNSEDPQVLVAAVNKKKKLVATATWHPVYVLALISNIQCVHDSVEAAAC